MKKCSLFASYLKDEQAFFGFSLEVIGRAKTNHFVRPDPEGRKMVLVQKSQNGFRHPSGSGQSENHSNKGAK